MDYRTEYDPPSQPRENITYESVYKENVGRLDQLRGEREELRVGIENRSARLQEVEALITGVEGTVDYLNQFVNARTRSADEASPRSMDAGRLGG